LRRLCRIVAAHGADAAAQSDRGGVLRYFDTAAPGAFTPMRKGSVSGGPLIRIDGRVRDSACSTSHRRDWIAEHRDLEAAWDHLRGTLRTSRRAR